MRGRGRFDRPLPRIYDPLDAVAHLRAAEVHEQAYLQVHEPKVRQYLFRVYRSGPFDRFDFDDYASFDEKVNTESAFEFQPAIDEVDRHLPLNAKALLRQVPPQQFFVN